MRYATPSDYDFIKQCWEENIDKLSILKDWVSDIYDPILSNDVLVEDGIGFCMMSIDTKNMISWVNAIFVKEEYRRQGYATEMIKEVVRVSRYPVIYMCFPNREDSNGLANSLGHFYAESFANFDRLHHNYYYLSQETVNKTLDESSIDWEFIKSITLDVKGDVEKVVLCRFKNEENLKAFADKHHLENLTKDCKWYDFHTHNFSNITGIALMGKTRDRYWKSQWFGMPDFVEGPNEKNYAYAEVEFRFHKEEVDKIDQIFEQHVDDGESYSKSSCWYPKAVEGVFSGFRVVGGERTSKYPIYVVSKSRSQNCATSKYLSQMEVPHFVVVEPQDYDDYCKYVQTEYATILILDMSYKEKYDCFDDLGLSKSTGPGPARNFCWDDSIKRGAKWHWVFDDNAIGGFFWLYQNQKIKCRTGAMFRVMEDFVDRYDNIAIAGIDYAFSCPISRKKPAFVLNTRIYSFLLIRNDIPYRWRGRYNEDTDLSLRALKDGWCTVDFDVFLAGKARTQAVKGGNTEVFYSKEGTLPKSKMIQDMHPDLARVTWKFGRWHHEVDYTGFTQELHLAEGQSIPTVKVDNYGMIVIPTNEKGSNDTRSYLEEKYSAIIDKVKKMNEERSKKSV